MLDIARDIQSLTDFKRRTAELVERVKKTGRPLVLTVNGRAEIVVQDATAYQALLERIELAESAAAIRQGITEFERGQGQPARTALEDLRRKHGLSG